MADNYVCENVVYMKHPTRVDITEWSKEHKGCNALILPSTELNHMVVVYFAKNDKGNEELKAIAETQPHLAIFRNGSNGIVE